MVKVILSFLLFLSAPVCGQEKIRLGWQIPWAVQGQLVQILKHTEIAKSEEIEFEFIGRTYGPQLNEIALAGEVDVILTADQPASILLGKNKGWKVIGRLMYNRTSTYVPLKSKLRQMSELKGKTIGVPIGAAAERVTSKALKTAQLDPQQDVTWVNVDIREHMVLAQKHRGDEKFGNLDALSGFDPTPAILEAQQLVRSLDVGKVVSFIVASEKVSRNEAQARQIVAVFAKAYDYYRHHSLKACEWFMKEALLPDSSQGACEITEALEPNLKLENKIALTLSADDLKLWQEAADFVTAKTGQKIVVRSHVVPWALETP